MYINILREIFKTGRPRPPARRFCLRSKVKNRKKKKKKKIVGVVSFEQYTWILELATPWCWDFYDNQWHWRHQIWMICSCCISSSLVLFPDCRQKICKHTFGTFWRYNKNYRWILNELIYIFYINGDFYYQVRE